MRGLGLAKKLERPKLNLQSIDRAAFRRPPSGMKWPNFDAMFDPDVVNPLDDLEMSGDFEQDAAAEYDAVERDFLDNESVAGDPYRVAIDPEFFFVVCFQSRAQKEEFLSKSGIGAAVGGDKYIDGLRLAKHLGVEIEPIPLKRFQNKLTPRNLRDVKIINKGGDF